MGPNTPGQSGPSSFVVVGYHINLLNYCWHVFVINSDLFPLILQPYRNVRGELVRPDTLSRTSQDSHDIKPETLPNQSKPVGSQTHSRESSDASYITYVVWWRGNLSSKQVTIVALNPRHLINFHTSSNNSYEPIWVHSFQSCRMTSFKEDNLRPHGQP